MSKRRASARAALKNVERAFGAVTDDGFATAG
jgi:hypothetical protein